MSAEKYLSAEEQQFALIAPQIVRKLRVLDQICKKCKTVDPKWDSCSLAYEYINNLRHYSPGDCAKIVDSSPTVPLK